MNTTKVAVASVALSLIGTTGANATADGCAVVLPTPDGFLNLRKAPMMGSEIITQLRPGERVEVAAEAQCEVKGTLSICNESKDWIRIDYVKRLDRGNYS